MDLLGILDDADHFPSKSLIDKSSTSEAGHFHRFFATQQSFFVQINLNIEEVEDDAKKPRVKCQLLLFPLVRQRVAK